MRFGRLLGLSLPGLDARVDMRDKRRMADLRVSIGAAARDALSTALAGARRSIEAEFHSVSDASIVGALNEAASRGVTVTLFVEGDEGRYKHVGKRHGMPESRHARDTYAHYAQLFDARIHLVAEADTQALEHAKAVVVDQARAFVATANPNKAGFGSPGEVLVEDDDPNDVRAIGQAILGTPVQSERVVAGPSARARERIQGLLGAGCDERMAIEDLSDPRIVDALISRHAHGLHDEVIINRDGRGSTDALPRLAAAGVDVRMLAQAFMHEKYIDAGDRIYIGSANLTRNGLDEAREIGIIASPRDFIDGADSLRADFDRMWSSATAVS